MSATTAARLPPALSPATATFLRSIPSALPLDDGAGRVGQGATDGVVRLEIADYPPTTVEVHNNSACAVLRIGGVNADRNIAIRSRYGPIRDSSDRIKWRRIQQAALVANNAGFLWRERVNRGKAGLS
jgi:hypothetical protein